MRGVDCVDEVGLGAQLWIVSAKAGLRGGCGLCRRDLFCARLACGGGISFARGCGLWGEGWIGARLWFVSERLGLARGCGLWGEVGAGARLWIVSAKLGLARGIIETA